MFELINIIGMLTTFNAQRNAAKEREKEMKKQNILESIKAAKQRQQAVVEHRRKLAAVANVASQTGVLESSGYAGSVSSLGSQLASNIGNSYTQTAFSKSMAKNEDKIARNEEVAAYGQLVSNLSKTLEGNGKEFAQKAAMVFGG